MIDRIQSSTKAEISSSDFNSTTVLGAGFQGSMDEISVALKVKSPEEILWDATAICYYSFDDLVTLDRGPFGLDSSASKVISEIGWRYNAVNFNRSNATYQTGPLTALGNPYQAFSITLWVRAGIPPGIFLTVSNPFTCLLVLGLQAEDKHIFAYLPNATADGNGLRLIGLKCRRRPGRTWPLLGASKVKRNSTRQDFSRPPAAMEGD